MRSWQAIAVAIVVAILVAGCGPGGGATRTTVELAGRSWVVLLATDDGMRDRDGFDGADGMLFDLDEDVDPQSIFFVMDRVRFPLDIAWFAGDGGLVGTASMPICPAEPCPRHAAPAPFRWAIEAPVGAFTALPPDARLAVGSP